MTTYGLTPTGFVRKPESQSLADIETRQRALVSPNIDQGSESPQGQLNGIFARQIGECWELLELIQNGFDPDKAGDASLEALGKLTGTERRGASYSVVAANCALVAGTTLLAGSHFALVAGNPKSRWTPVENFTAPTTGTHSVKFRAEFVGPVNAAGSSITVIGTPVTGWTTVTNPNPPTLGIPVDLNSTLRQRRETSLTAAGSATAKAIRQDLLGVDGVGGITGVIDVLVLENDTDVTDANGVPPFSIEVIIWDGPSAVADDVEIAQAIFDAKGATVKTYGGITQTAQRYDGEDAIVRFSRVTVRNVYLDVFVTAGTGYVGDAAVKSHIVDNSDYGVGEDVIALDVRYLPRQLTGVTDVPSLELGFSASPSGTLNLAVSPREIALFDVSRITVTS